jgi:hypothetical protein
MTSISDCLPNLPTISSLGNTESIVILRVINGQLRPALASISTLRPGNATNSVLGIVRLAGDLAGSAEAPTVPGLALKANVNSPALTGTPTAPTPAATDNSTKIATTAHVKGAIAEASLNDLEDTLITSLSEGQVLAWNGVNWVNRMVAGTGDLLALNNLNDVSNKQTALNNLINGSNNIFTTGALRWNTNYNTIVDLPSAATYRGMFAVAGTTPYYSTGAAWVNLNSNITTIGSLLDVNISNLQPSVANQVLGYDTTQSRWVARTLPPLPPANLFTNLGALTDVNLSGFNSTLPNQYLSYDTIQNKWIARTVTTTGSGSNEPSNLSELLDVSTSTLDPNGLNQVLGYDRAQSKWVPRVITPPIPPPPPGPTRLSQLLDVSTTTLNTGITGQVLSWNPTQQRWMPFVLPAQVIGPTTIAGMTDVNLTTLNTSLPGQYLAFDEVQDRWVPRTLPVQTSISSTSDIPEGTNLYYTNARADARAISVIGTQPLSALADVANVAASPGMFLGWSGTAWTPTNLPSGGGNGGGGGGGTTLPLDTKGDILTYSTNVDRLAVGSVGSCLMVNDQTPTGLVWAQPTLDQLADVDSSGASNNEVLTRVGSTWLPRPVASDLNALSDVILTSPTAGETLIFNAGWANGKYKLVDLEEVNIETNLLNARSVLGWSVNNAAWQVRDLPTTTDHLSEGTTNLFHTPARVNALISATNLDALANVVITAPQPNQSLVRNSLGQWVNEDTALSQLVSKGDILTFTGTDFVRLPIGNNGQALTVELAAPGGLAWRAAGVNPSLDSLADTEITYPLSNWSVLAFNEATGKWVDKDFSNQVSLQRQVMVIDQPIFLTLNSPGNQHLDPLPSTDPQEPESFIRDCYLPANPLIGTRFRVLNLKTAYTINVRVQNGNSIVLALGPGSATFQAEFTWDGVGWYYWG